MSNKKNVVPVSEIKNNLNINNNHILQTSGLVKLTAFVLLTA